MRFTWRHALVFTLCLLPFLYVAAFAIPGGDDFARADRARYLFDVYEGLHEMLRAWWKWSGRYTHHFMVVFVGELTEHSIGYGLGCMAVVLFFGLGFYGLFATLNSNGNKLVPALMGLYAVYGGFQALGSVAYLLTDILGIWLGAALFVWYLWGVCRLWLAERPGRSHLWFPAVTGVLSIGCYEHSALAVLLVTLAVWFMARRCGHPYEATFRKLALVIGIAFMAMFFARGNFRRQTKRGADLEFIRAQLLQFGQDWQQAVGWFFRSVFPLGALLLALAVEPRRRTDIRNVHPVLIIAGAACILLLFTAGITLVHAASDVSVNRVGKLPASMALLCGIMLCALLIRIAGPLRELLRHMLPSWVSAWLLVLGFAGGVFWMAPNTADTLCALTSGRIAAVYENARVRQRVVEQASGADRDVLVAPLSMPYPLSVGFAPGGNPAAWPNPEFSRLYKLKSIRAAWPEAEAAVLEEAGASMPEYIPGIGQLTLGKDPDPDNATFDYDWIVLKPEQACGRIHMLLIPAPGPDRLLPRFVQEFLLGDHGELAGLLPASAHLPPLREQHTLVSSVQTRLTGYDQVFERDPSREAWALPLRSHAAGPLAALYISTDGTHFRRVRQGF